MAHQHLEFILSASRTGRQSPSAAANASTHGPFIQEAPTREHSLCKPQHRHSRQHHLCRVESVCCGAGSNTFVKTAFTHLPLSEPNFYCGEIGKLGTSSPLLSAQFSRHYEHSYSTTIPITRVHFIVQSKCYTH